MAKIRDKFLMEVVMMEDIYRLKSGITNTDSHFKNPN
jgi:hypothetical protein